MIWLAIWAVLLVLSVIYIFWGKGWAKLEQRLADTSSTRVHLAVNVDAVVDYARRMEKLNFLMDSEQCARWNALSTWPCFRTETETGEDQKVTVMVLVKPDDLALLEAMEKEVLRDRGEGWKETP